MTGPLHRSDTYVDPSADAEAWVRRIVREELERQGALLGREWVSQRAAGQVAGAAPKTIRSWQKRGLLTKGRRARVCLAELKRFLAGGGAEGHQLPRLDVARRQRAAEEIAAKLAEGVETSATAHRSAPR